MRNQQDIALNGVRKSVLIVEDHTIMRYGLTQLIQAQADLEVYGEAENVRQALSALISPFPDLILTDVTMDGPSGLELAEMVREQHPTIPVLILSMHDETIFAERALRAGARGYIMKNEPAEQLLEAIRRVLGGQVYISDRVSARILDSISTGRPYHESSPLSVLTDREFEVFRLMSQALPTDEIGQRLCISEKTVETHRRHIREKLKLESGAEVRKYAVRWGAIHDMI